MSKLEMSEHEGSLPCSKDDKLWSSQDKQQIIDDAELIKHHKYGGRIFVLVKVPAANERIQSCDKGHFGNCTVKRT